MWPFSKLFNRKSSSSQGESIVTPAFDVQDKQFMQRAIELAQHAESLNEVPVGAVVVKDGKIIGEGFNQPIAQNDPSAHAEIMALRSAGLAINNYRLVDATVYVTLEPCAMCAMAMVHARVKRVIYGANDLKTGACGSVFPLIDSEHHNHRVEVDGGLLAEQCGTLLSNFFKRRRREKKQRKGSSN